MIAIGIAVVAAQPARDPDLFWHLGTGRWIRTNLAIPFSDPFSWTSRGRAWIAHEWLTEVLYDVAYRVGGFSLLVLIGAATILAAMAAVHGTARHLGASRRAALVGTGLGALACTNTWGARPQMTTLALSAVFFRLLLRESEPLRRNVVRAATRTRSLWVFPVLMLAWVNLHGGYIFGLAMTVGAAVAVTCAPIARRLGHRPMLWHRCDAAPRARAADATTSPVASG
jgi:hypothetical protein